MRELNSARTTIVMWLAVCALAVPGCSRGLHRLRADCDAYLAIEERNHDPRWAAQDYGIEMDPRSRYFDGYDLDHAPMPQDDPSSHLYMHLVDGKKGWAYWHANGERRELENPAWLNALREYVDVGDDGSVKLDVDSAVRLAYVHSPNHQRQLETMYLSALDVTAERFRLDTQFFGGFDTIYNHRGSRVPPSLAFDPVAGKYVVTPPAEVAGLDSNRLTLGRPSAGNPSLLASRRFATAGELLVGFANSFVFEFTGGDASLSASLAHFSFIQPLLRGAGRDIALEQLTFEERKLLANLRAYSQFRQGFYTQVAIGELGVVGPQRGGSSTNLQSFGGQGGVGGYLGLLQQQQQIRNSEDNLALQQRTLARLEALLANDLIDLVQVDQFRQDIARQRSSLLAARNSLQLDLDRYKTTTLGLPPNLPIELDYELIRQFQLIPREATAIQNGILGVQQRVGQFPEMPALADVRQAMEDARPFLEPMRQLIEVGRQDLERMNAIVPLREATLTDEEKELFERNRERVIKLFSDLEQEFEKAVVTLEGLQTTLSEETLVDTTDALVTWLADFLQLTERFALVPAQARLETITVDTIDLEPEGAFQVALSHRLDFMNGRAALVDRWRLIQVSADALQSVVNITSSGDLRTARNNPLSFRAPTANMRLGLEFDAPLTRVLERQAYRETLIEYQRSRRELIQSHDSLHLGLRALLRNLEQLRKDLEIQRLAVTIAMRRVDETQLSLNPPRQPPQPGQRPPINPTTAINLLGAQTSLRDTQNAFLAVWMNYYATRLRLYRELGIMSLDPEGRWIEEALDEAIRAAGGEEEPGAEDLPPMVPTAWMEAAEQWESKDADPPPVVTGPSDAQQQRVRPVSTSGPQRRRVAPARQRATN